MTRDEFEVSFSRLRKQLFSDALKTKIANEAEVNRYIDIDLGDSFADGFDTKNSHWLTILNDEASAIGSIWYSFRGEGSKKTPYLGDVYIDPAFRGQGFGKQALILFETHLKSQKIDNNIAVHIVGNFNESAIRMFESAGYRTSAILMEKRLHPLD